jgi:3-hydroxyisobutyrate dehydrogenase-like beta-hydroxyacid dehydrogenase
MSTPADKVVGLIGVGLLGGAIAQRLVRAGFTVIGYDRVTGARERLVQIGGKEASSASDVARQCSRMVLSLPDSSVVECVVAEIGNGFRAGQVVLDTTTGDPAQTIATARALAGRGVHYLDATVSGSSEQMAAGDAMVMVGGPPEIVYGCDDLLWAMGPQHFHVGPVGSAAKMKLVTNLVLGLNRAALAEGLAFAAAAGMDLPKVLEVLKASAAYSTVMDVKGRKMITGDFTPQARLAQHHKDVRLILQEAARSGLALPLSQTHDRLLSEAEASGLGEADNSAILRVYLDAVREAGAVDAPGKAGR